MDLLTQLNKAIAYVEEHINDETALADVSNVTSYSAYHFGRMFYYIAGMPLSEYIRKRKLSLAAMDLQSGNEKVIDVAVKYGYDSADSFTRAFSKQHGVTPSASRKPGVSLTIFPPLTFKIKIEGVQEMNWRIEKTEAFEVIGIERVCKNNEAFNLSWFWDECFGNGSYDKLAETANGGRCFGDDGQHTVMGLCGYRDTGTDTFPYMLCALKKPGVKMDGYVTAAVPKLTWAVFKSETPNRIGEKIAELYKLAYTEWLPSSSYKKADGPDLELYYTDEHGRNSDEVWIPIADKN